MSRGPWGIILRDIPEEVGMRAGSFEQNIVIVNSSTVHARIDLDTKTSSEEILRSIGMNPSDSTKITHADW